MIIVDLASVLQPMSAKINQMFHMIIPLQTTDMRMSWFTASVVCMPESLQFHGNGLHDTPKFEFDQIFFLV